MRLVTVLWILFAVEQSIAFAPPLSAPSSTRRSVVHGRVLRPAPAATSLVHARALLTPRHASSMDVEESETQQGTRHQRQDNLANKLVWMLWKGFTLPFPALRRVLLLGRPRKKDKIVLGLTLQQCMLFLVAYLAAGVVAYHFVLEHWSIIDALYFTCVSFSTVGYGDLCPSTLASKMFTCAFGIGGIAFLGTAVATLGHSVVEAEVEAMRKARGQSRRRVMKIFEGMPNILHKHGREHKERTISKNLLNKYKLKVRLPVKETTLSTACTIVKSLLPTLSIVLGGAGVVRYLNGGGWSLLDSIYFALVTASTIGFGDMCPQTPAAKLWAVAYIPLSVAAVGELLSSVAVSLTKRKQREVYEKQLEKDLTIEHLHAMDTDGDGKITREEYVDFMLVEMGVVSKEELDELYRQFDRLDVTRSGYLDNDDLKLMAELRGATVIDEQSGS